jgi:ATP-dependent DNA ligase
MQPCTGCPHGEAMARTTVAKRKADFIETMDCLPVPKLPEGPEWSYELKLDGYRLES